MCRSACALRIALGLAALVYLASGVETEVLIDDLHHLEAPEQSNDIEAACADYNTTGCTNNEYFTKYLKDRYTGCQSLFQHREFVPWLDSMSEKYQAENELASLMDVLTTKLFEEAVDEDRDPCRDKARSCNKAMCHDSNYAEQECPETCGLCSVSAGKLCGQEAEQGPGDQEKQGTGDEERRLARRRLDKSPESDDEKRPPEETKETKEAPECPYLRDKCDHHLEVQARCPITCQEDVCERPECSMPKMSADKQSPESACFRQIHQVAPEDRELREAYMRNLRNCGKTVGKSYRAKKVAVVESNIKTIATGVAPWRCQRLTAGTNLGFVCTQVSGIKQTICKGFHHEVATRSCRRGVHAAPIGQENKPEEDRVAATLWVFGIEYKAQRAPRYLTKQLVCTESTQQQAQNTTDTPLYTCDVDKLMMCSSGSCAECNVDCQARLMHF